MSGVINNALVDFGVHSTEMNDVFSDYAKTSVGFFFFFSFSFSFLESVKAKSCKLCIDYHRCRRA